MRLDMLLVEQNLVQSRARAQAMIKAGKVHVEGMTKVKASTDIPEGTKVKLLEADHPYVSRAAFKLKSIIDATGFTFKGKTVLDLGASTGGFTQVAIENHAKHVYAVDVGHGQLDARLQKDSKITNLEKTDARTLTPKLIKKEPEVLLCDVSFISSTKILPHVVMAFPSITDVFVLVKPQFELTKDDIGPGGIVRSKERQRDALTRVQECLQGLGFETPTFVKAPMAHAGMNQEFMLHGRKAAE
ncbi:MAG: TlyA family rRNA (cytidine-2'-O)-methyltransferase [Magnetococcales bacterium]|nr:TlyA family rRNA (cytidine-2'-O)-methyltransferase [Magnetococcales bacterium]|tara:strand:+ start:643192 stop:643923 length:732 start_codon:yes stop_codon:yes gene_type:complete